MVKLLFLCSAVLMLSLSGCAHYGRPHLDSTAYSPETMEIIGPAEGSVTKTYLLSFPIDDGGAGDYSLSAVKSAIYISKADALINIISDESYKFYFSWLLYEKTIHVQGIAVRFKRKS